MRSDTLPASQVQGQLPRMQQPRIMSTISCPQDLCCLPAMRVTCMHQL